MTTKKQGMALLLTVGVGGVLIALAVALVSLFLADYQMARRQQQSIQAYWNARSGVERYLQSGKLPESGAFELGRNERCSVETRKNGDLCFIGQSQGVTHRLTLVGGEPSRVSELRP